MFCYSAKVHIVHPLKVLCSKVAVGYRSQCCALASKTIACSGWMSLERPVHFNEAACSGFRLAGGAQQDAPVLLGFMSQQAVP
jgi:hypothetical protein